MKDKILAALCAIYLLITSFNLTLLPIFNDESIYLDWGIRATTQPGMLYYSVYDGKPPLMIWFFGIFEQLLPDPLLAGRLVSIIFGLATLLGIFSLSKFLFGKKTAYITSVLYIFSPLIFFFNRQALMESGVAATGVWSTYFFIRFLKSNMPKHAFYSGLISGIGLFIKTNATFFLIVSLVAGTYRAYKTKSSITVKSLFLMIAAFCGGSILLLINPDFWATMHRNARYGMTLSELLRFPIGIWANSLYINSLILLTTITPFILIASIYGLIQWRKKYALFILLIVSPIILETLTVRQPVQRYLVSYTPLLLIPAGFVFSNLINNKKPLGFIVFLVSILPALYLVCLQIFSPVTYFHTTRLVPNITDNGYIAGQLSGYGVNALVPKINALADKKILVMFAENTGNPESAVNIYFEKNKNIQTGYMQSSYFGDQLKNYTCIIEKNGTPMYFVSRSSYLAGLEKFITQIDTIKLPESQEFIGIYRVNNDCPKEKSLIVEPVMSP